MSLSDLRKELKDLRKKAMPIPVSRMKKGDVAAELARLRGKEEVAVKEAVKDAPKPVVKKVEAVQKIAHKEQEEVLVRKTKGLKERGMEEPPKKKQKVEEKPKEKAKPKSESDKPAKGSEEMKARMAKLREMRMKKKD
jgi:hypothetical protein